MKKIAAVILALFALSGCEEHPVSEYNVKFVLGSANNVVIGRDSRIKSNFYLNGRELRDYYVFPRNCPAAITYKGGDVFEGKLLMFKQTMKMELPSATDNKEFLNKVATICAGGEVGSPIKIVKLEK